jgi:hypothetical protein
MFGVSATIQVPSLSFWLLPHVQADVVLLRELHRRVCSTLRPEPDSSSISS